MQHTRYAVVLVAVTLLIAVVATTGYDSTAGAEPSTEIQGVEIAGDEATVNDSPSSFTLSANGTAAWENADGSIDSFDVFLYIEGPDGHYDAVDFNYGNAAGETGEQTFELSGDVFESTPWEPADFTPGDGETIQKELGVKVVVYMEIDGGYNEVYETETDAITITVHDGGGGGDGDSGNATVSITASGSADISE